MTSLAGQDRVLLFLAAAARRQPESDLKLYVGLAEIQAFDVSDEEL